jgi:hypothetical protein
MSPWSFLLYVLIMAVLVIPVQVVFDLGFWRNVGINTVTFLVAALIVNSYENRNVRR